jgi:uncharacterized Ntn-hydrolase superfamily protein
MTWSIIVRETDDAGKTTRFGIAITSRFFAVGAMCPAIRPGAGAVCSQALMNPTYPPRGLRLLAEGVPAPDCLRLLLESDAGRDFRQVHMIDDAGRIAQHTGPGPRAWAGHVQAPNVSVAGNILAGPAVVEETLETWLKRSDLAMEHRLMAALDAGQAAGGDSRGKESVAILIYRDQEWPELDLRVDNHAEPFDEMRRLIHESTRRFTTFRSFLATKQNLSGVFDRPAIDKATLAAEAAFRELP